jgi:hypothetical protein
MGDNKCEGSLYIEIDDKWKNLFCWIRNGNFQAFEKQRVVSVSNQSNTRQAVLEVQPVISFQIPSHELADLTQCVP